jgi:transposase
LIKYAAYEKKTFKKGVLRSMESSVSQEISELQATCRKVNRGIEAMRITLMIMKKLNLSDELIISVLGFSERTIEEWESRFEQDNVAGLKDLPRSGRTPKLSEAQVNELKFYVETSSKKESQEKITSVEKIIDKIQNDFQVKFSSSGLYKMLHSIGLSKIIPRPIHEKNDPEKISKWLEDLPEKINKIIDLKKESKINFYFQDESRYGQKTIYTGVWSLTGNNIEYENQDGFLNSWIFGAVNPKTGEKFGLILPKLDSDNMQIFLDEFSKTIMKGEHVIMILDGSYAHKNSILIIPENISFIFLPPYSPKLNPIERLWKWIKSHYLAFKKYSNIEEIIDSGVDGWNKTSAEIIKSVCKCSYLDFVD